MTPRDTARMWLSDPLSIVLDFETTGWVGYACEVAVIGVNGTVLLHTRVNPVVTIEPSTTAVHGMTIDALIDEPRWKDIAVDIALAIGGKNVIAYGAPFDRGVLRRELTRDGTSLRVIEWRCVMQLWRQHAGLRSTVKLETLVPTANHSALGDAQACLDVLRRIANYRTPIHCPTCKRVTNWRMEDGSETTRGHLCLTPPSQPT